MARGAAARVPAAAGAALAAAAGNSVDAEKVGAKAPVDLGDTASLKRALDDYVVQVCWPASGAPHWLALCAALCKLLQAAAAATSCVALRQVLADSGYEEDHYVSNVKIGLGTFTCAAFLQAAVNARSHERDRAAAEVEKGAQVPAGAAGAVLPQEVARAVVDNACLRTSVRRVHARAQRVCLARGG